jgi:predicted DNA-binding transcriptional regulator AlpA
MDTPALLSTHARLARCPLRPFPPSSRRLRIDQTAQFELPFAVETEPLSANPEPQPSPASAAARKTRGSRNFETPARRVPKRNDHSRKPPAREVPAANGTLLKNSQEAPVEVQFLRLPDVKAVTGLGKTSIYELIRDKSFPAPVRLGPRAVAWVRSEVRQWALEHVHASRSVA